MKGEWGGEDPHSLIVSKNYMLQEIFDVLIKSLPFKIAFS